MGRQKIHVDLTRHEAMIDEQRIELTPIEARILAALLEQPRQVWSRQLLVREALGADSPTMERAIDVHIANLRRKLGSASRQIETVRGQGYRWTTPRDTSESV